MSTIAVSVNSRDHVEQPYCIRLQTTTKNFLLTICLKINKALWCERGLKWSKKIGRGCQIAHWSLANYSWSKISRRSVSDREWTGCESSSDFFPGGLNEERGREVRNLTHSVWSKGRWVAIASIPVLSSGGCLVQTTGWTWRKKKHQYTSAQEGRHARRSEQLDHPSLTKKLSGKCMGTAIRNLENSLLRHPRR